MTNSHRAGKRGERGARDELRRLWHDARRGIPQTAGALEADVENVPLCVEVKEWSRWPDVEAAIAQVNRDAEKRGDSRPRCVIHRRKNRLAKFRTGWRITMELDEFIRLMKEEI